MIYQIIIPWQIMMLTRNPSRLMQPKRDSVYFDFGHSFAF
jgi:hypothetical protein